MARRILFSRPDGTVCVVVPAPEYEDAPDLSAIAQRAIRGQGLEATETEYEVIEATALPPSRRWRNAWRQSGKVVAPDLAAARKIRRAELLRLRDDYLALVRADYLADEEDKKPKAEIDAKKDKARRLRELDTTLDARLDALAGLEALAGFLPEEFAEV